MDINNNQQINTFTKGMNTDTSDAFIGADQYRYAENLRISTDTNSSGGTLVPIDGTVRIDNTICDWDDIIAVTSARDMLIVVGTKKVDDLVYMQVYEYNTTDEYLLDVSPRSWRQMLVEGSNPTGMLLGNDSSVPSSISTVVRWESDRNVKLYIADGVHTLMVIRLDKQTDVEQAESGQDSSGVLLSPPKISLITEYTGDIRAAKVQYVYRFFIEGGAATGLSPISDQLVLYKDQNHGYGIDGDEGPSTGRAVYVEIPQDTISAVQSENSSINAIEIYRISYLLTGHEPKIDLIFSDVIEQWDGIDRGDSINTITIEELLSYAASQIKPREIESKGDYLFCANISYVKDGVDDKFKDIDTTAPSVGGNEPFKTYKWVRDQWIMPGTENSENPVLGGIGQYFKWEFSIKTVSIGFDNDIREGSETDDITSLRRGEVYRYGVILYDEHGQASSPKFIADIMVPPESEYPVVNQFDESGAILNRIGVKFSLVNDLSDKGVAGWEIVRCGRSYKDRINLFQGICSLPLLSYKDTREGATPWNDYAWSNTHFSSLSAERDNLYPGGFWSMQYYRDAWNGVGNVAYSDPNTLMFACPEYCYMEADTQNQIGNTKEKSFVFEPCACYNIPTYKYGQYAYIKSQQSSPDGMTVSSFRSIPTIDMFGNTSSEIIPNEDDGQWIDAYGPEGIDSEDIRSSYISDGNSFNDCINIRLLDNTDIAQYAAFYHITPVGVCDVSQFTHPNTNVGINECAYVTVPEDQYKSFSSVNGENKSLTFMNNTTNIGSKNFINWVASGIDAEGYEGQLQVQIIDALTASNANIKGGPKKHGYITENTVGLVRYAGTGGKCILLSAKTDDGQSFGYFNSQSLDNIFPIQIGNIKNSNAIPYGGFSNQSKLSSVYYGYGNFTDGAELDVFDGDTYLCMFTYNAAHCFVDKDMWNIPKLSVIYTVPIESNINLKARAGYLYQDAQKNNQSDMNRFIQDHPVSIQLYETGYTQGSGNYAYIYNAAYDSLPDVLKYIPVYYNSVQSNTYDCRIHYTKPKENNQAIDTWFSSDSDSFIDVDSRYGAVTGMRLFKDKLIFWQERATGLLTVNEKTVVSNVDNGNIILADNPGVVQRYDYISTKYGMKKGQHTDTQSDNALYWWDSDNKELLQYSNGLVPLTKAHLVENYINEREESVKPCVSYYCDFDEIIANVRRRGERGESLVFNEKLNTFTGIYTFDPIYSSSIGNDLYLAKASTTSGDKAEMHVMSSNENSANTYLFSHPAYPAIQYIVNNQSTFVKTFDIQTMGGNFYGGGGHGERSTNQVNNQDLKMYPRVTLKGNDTQALRPLKLSYQTPLRQYAEISGDRMTNREYDFRLDIPRNGDSQDWGDRLRGKTMQCTIKSDSNSKNFSLQYVITKYRMSWS